MLPNVDYHNQGIYTEPQRPYSAAASASATPSAQPAPIFIANNSVREYISQGVVSETIGYGRIADLRKADAEAAAAKARLEVARRGLVATVVGDYYGLLAAEARERITAEALVEAQTFVRVSTQLEAGGEVSHNDVLKANLTLEQRLRDHDDALLASVKSRLDLGVLLFPDPRTPFALNINLSQPPSLATRAELEANAKTGNVDVRAALASLRAADAGISSAIGGYFPDLALSYNYGIDSDHFAVHDANGVRNLGYAASATLDIPVWDWFATRAKVRQSQLQRTLAQADLTVAQRRALAAFQQFYGEADLASRQIASLDRSVADASEALRLTDLRYAAGEGSALEVVDAQSTLVSAETARVDGAIRYYTALANLQTMTGNLP